MKNKVELEYINIENMLVDPLTKSNSGVQMSKFTYLIFKEQFLIVNNTI